MTKFEFEQIGTGLFCSKIEHFKPVPICSLLVLLGFALFDIAINNNAINEQREAQAKERSSVVKEEEQLALLERYKKIHADGLISDEEFELRKKAIMRDLSRK